MPKKLTNGKIAIGAYLFPDRKLPMLCVEKGNECYAYGRFNSIESANKFMDILGGMVGAVFEDKEIDFDYEAEDGR